VVFYLDKKRIWRILIELNHSIAFIVRY